MLTKVD